MPPYVGMARKQNGGYHGSISVQTPIFHLVVNSTRLKTLRSAVWRCPKLYIILRVFAVLPLENRHEIALYRSASQFIFFERCLESRTSLLSSAMAMGF